ncbi:redoxin domain-containing protein [Sphingomonas sp. PAMC 26605]|uniref:redoxin domain-containing protein n=1 Tax=Sphingomonas sp. PAMC 26605 TaxID=1112214 RepID=UPI00026CD7FA|nr:redoxin domain-containing protein [Sphingomonas sp. PAMC 26605]
MTSAKMTAGAHFPDLSWRAVGGGRIAPAQDAGWRLLVVYRGKHCPVCRQYLKTLDGMLQEFADAGITVYAVSADPQERAEQEAAEEGWHVPVGYDLSSEEMATLGTYVSTPRSPEETDRPFSEPALFVVDPAGKAYVIAVSNAPFARPDLQMLLRGLRFVMDKDYPIRGRG